MTPQNEKSEGVLDLIESARRSNSIFLDLSKRKLTTIPDSLAQLANLHTLHLGGNAIAAIPDSLAQLINLQTLVLDSNQIAAIPDSLAQLVNLHTLDLGGNAITAIPDSLGKLVNLQTLALDSNQIAAIPDSLAQLVNLQTLGLRSNQIAAIPDSLAQLVNLQTLGLRSNQIAAIPDSLAQLVNLQTLHLGSNQIATIPDSLAQMSDLHVLYLNDNRITAIPSSIARLAQLEKLGLSGNPLPEEAFAALKRGIPSFFRYLLSKQKVYPRTVKVVLVGEPKSGKTTLLEALKGNPHPCDDSRKETLGVNVVNIEKLHPTDHKTMYLSVWDFAGQHIEHATHQFFLTEHAIYLILWNARQGTQAGKRDLWYWLELLKMRVPNPRFLLVATHTEHTPPDLDLSEIDRFYSGCQGNYPVELESMKGMEALQTKILELAADSPSLRAEWPAEWLPVRDEVRRIRQKQPHITPAAFRKLMSSMQVTDAVAQKDLAGQLHNLGEILYFQERDELSSLVILNPEWVTELIALVVRSSEVRQNGGILRETDLAKLWKDASLPPEVQDHLIHLMDWFDLTYATGHKSDLGIVVEALPYSTPQDLTNISLPSGQPQMEMIYSFPELKRRLPPGIPTWTIARAHRYRKGKPWRDAAAFEDTRTKSRALILASETAREVRLRVVADFPPFFFGLLEGILRDTFERYPGAEAECRIPCPCQISDGKATPCSNSYLFESVLKRKREGKRYVSCDRSGDDVAIDSLLTGFHPRTEEGEEALHSTMRRLFTAQLTAQREQMEKTCPSVFTLTPVRTFKQLATWLESVTKDEELELALYCEQDSDWHTTAESVYRFTPDQQWFDKLKKQWNQLAGITKHVGPLAKAFGKVTVSPWVEAAGLGMEKLPGASRSAVGEVLRGLQDRPLPNLIDIETRHLLEDLIDYLDSSRSTIDRKKGGLYPYLIEDGRLLWLCSEHLKEYKKR